MSDAVSPRSEAAVAEDVEDALVDGDRALRPGTARAAFAHPTFRTVYLGAFASNIGTWMQNVVLGALAYDLTRSGTFVGLITAAQLGPMLLLSIVGGAIADTFDRRRTLTILALQQAVFSLVLAVIASPAEPDRVALVLAVLAIGVGNALYAPTFSAVVPILVPRRDLAGAIALNSVQMNASRVVGPAIGSILFSRFGASWVFALNGLSYLVVVAAIARVTLPAPVPSASRGVQRVVEGLRYARTHREVAQTLVTVFVLSLLTLPFITQMPTLADVNLGIAARSDAYGFLYAAFGLGAVVGALSIGTLFAPVDKARLARFGLVAFGALLVVWALLRDPGPAYPVAFLVGAAYFTVITSLSTVLQQDLDDGVRGKVLALWIMGFGGTVPFGGLLGGWFAERTSITAMVLVGAAVAFVLAVLVDLRPTRRSSAARVSAG
ncbi:MAG: MFS transporter [Acidimicrobiales bacterium]|nr:MFS transporter [Acidimicrobiales bacterium]